jgi:p-aminobenzoyl-glutamate transporter AbgT
LGAVIVPLVILIALGVGVAANPGLRELFSDALHRIDPRAVAVTLPVQLIAILVCTAAQQALKVGIPFVTALSRGSRAMRATIC